MHRLEGHDAQRVPALRVAVEVPHSLLPIGTRDGRDTGLTHVRDGPRLRAAGVRTVVDADSLAVVGLVEVISHIPRIYGEYRKLLAAAAAVVAALPVLLPYMQLRQTTGFERALSEAIRYSA